MKRKKLCWCLGALVLALGLTAFVYYWHTRRAYSTANIEDTDGPTTIFICGREPSRCLQCFEKISFGLTTAINRIRNHYAN